MVLWQPIRTIDIYARSHTLQSVMARRLATSLHASQSMVIRAIVQGVSLISRQPQGVILGVSVASAEVQIVSKSTKNVG